MTTYRNFSPWKDVPSGNKPRTFEARKYSRLVSNFWLSSSLVGLNVVNVYFVLSELDIFGLKMCVFLRTSYVVFGLCVVSSGWCKKESVSYDSLLRETQKVRSDRYWWWLYSWILTLYSVIQNNAFGLINGWRTTVTDKELVERSWVKELTKT